ncbi:MAG: DUF1844 domain-containing protein [Phycisphaerales bacterium]
MNQDEAQGPKLHIDSDWKNQAQAEKDKLADLDAQSEAAGASGAQELPPADFKTLIGAIATNAVMSLGGMNDPKSGQVMIDLEGAKLYIDLLSVLEEKTQGNIDDEEKQYLERVIHELRLRFVDFSKAIAEQMAREQGGAPSGPTTTAGGGGQSPIIQP